MYWTTRRIIENTLSLRKDFTNIYLGPIRTRRIFIYFSKYQFHFTSADAGFDSYQILSNTTKLQKRRRPASEQDKFLSNENLVETKSVFIFGRAEQMLSA